MCGKFNRQNRKLKIYAKPWKTFKMKKRCQTSAEIKGPGVCKDDSYSETKPEPKRGLTLGEAELYSEIGILSEDRGGVIIPK